MNCSSVLPTFVKAKENLYYITAVIVYRFSLGLTVRNFSQLFDVGLIQIMGTFLPICKVS